jgi:hypothetical protein
MGWGLWRKGSVDHSLQKIKGFITTKEKKVKVKSDRSTLLFVSCDPSQCSPFSRNAHVHPGETCRRIQLPVNGAGLESSPLSSHHIGPTGTIHKESNHTAATYPRPAANGCVPPCWADCLLEPGAGLGALTPTMAWLLGFA